MSPVEPNSSPRGTPFRRAALSAGLLAMCASLLGAGLLEARRPPAEPARPPGDGTYVLGTTWPLPEAPAQPIDLALGPAGDLYVADGRHNAIQVYDRDGRLRETWDHPPFSRSADYVFVPLAVAADPTSGMVHILWERHNRATPQAAASGLFLDSRLPGDPNPAPAQAITAIANATDMAIGPQGHLFFTSGGAIHHMPMPARVIDYAFEVGDTRGAAGQLAVTPDGRIGVARPAQGVLAVYRLDGAPLGSLSLRGQTPLAVAADSAGNLLVLTRPSDPDNPSAALVMTFDPLGNLRTSSAGALRAPPPAAGNWPWAIAASDAGMVLSTGATRFEVHRYGASQFTLSGSAVRPDFTPFIAEEPPDPQLALDATSDAGVVVLDGRETRLVRFAADGSSRLAGALPDDSRDVAVGSGGEVYVSTASGEILAYAAGDPLAPSWQVGCDCELGGRLAAGADVLYVSRPRYKAVAALDIASHAVLREIRAPAEVGLWPSDIAVGADGRLFTSDLVTAQVQIWSAPGAPEVAWQAGLLAGPRRLATGRLFDGTPIVAASMADGYVELHSIEDGNLLARWAPELGDGTPFEVSDIAVDNTGRVFLADRQARAIRVFEPGAGIPPTPPPNPTATPTRSALSCTVRGDKLAQPDTLTLGQTVEVTLTLAADCPTNTRVVGADIVLVIDRSGSMRGAKIEAAKGAARSFAELLDVRHHRLGLASFATDATIDVPLTDSVATVLDGIEALAVDTGGQTNMAAGVERAHANLRDFGRAEALPVILLMTDGRYSAQTPDPRPPAAAARNWGAQIYTVGLGDDVDGDVLRQMAGSPERYFFAPTPSELFPIYSQILRLVLSSLAGNLTIDDLLGDGMNYVPGSANPSALVSTGRLRWGRSLLPSSGITLSYRIVPQALGCWPTNDEALADFTDADGARRQFRFPVPTVCVVTPTPTPTATPTPEIAPIFLPIAYRNQCLPGIAHADVVLLVDTSDSMSGAKLEVAKASAILFVGLLDLPKDQAAIIGFNANARPATRLTGERAVLEAAIVGLSSSQGTRIDRALQAATVEMLGSNRNRANQPVIVLLSDGAHNGPKDDVLRAAAQARAVGATIYAIGLGADADRGLLTDVAGAERTYFAPDADQLAEIYRGIAVAIPCR